LPLFGAADPLPRRPEPAQPDEVRTALEALDLDELSPKAALDALYKLRKLAERRQ
jgi:DNA mismatch repair protein MutS